MPTTDQSNVQKNMAEVRRLIPLRSRFALAAVAGAFQGGADTHDSLDCEFCIFIYHFERRIINLI